MEKGRLAKGLEAMYATQFPYLGRLAKKTGESVGQYLGLWEQAGQQVQQVRDVLLRYLSTIVIFEQLKAQGNAEGTPPTEGPEES